MPPRGDTLLNASARTVVRHVFSLCTILFALPTYLALGARFWWVLDLATHFCVFYAISLLPFVAILLLAKRWRLLTFVSVAMAINVLQLVPFYSFTRAPAASATLRIASINVLYNNSQHERLLDVVRQESPEIVLLLEVDASWDSTLATLKDEFPYSLIETRTGSFGIALFSKLPLEDLQLFEIGSSGIPSVKATVRFQGTPVQIVGTHFMPPMGGMKSSLRNEQLYATAFELARISRPCLVLGDLNITPWSPFFRDLLRKGNLLNSQVGFGIQPSWLGVLPIDHLLHSADISIHERRIGARFGSDHRPLVVDFALK